MMSFVLLGLLFIPCRIFAVPPSSAVASDHVESLEPAPIEVTSETPAAYGSEEPSRVYAGAMQAAAGLVGGAVLSPVGMVIGAASCPGSFWTEMGCGYVGGGIAAALGFTVATWAMGEWLGWDGSLLATVAGLVVTSVVLSYAFDAGGSGASEALTPMAYVLVPAGAVVGYQLSAEWSKNPGVAAMPRVTSVPIVAIEF